MNFRDKQRRWLPLLLLTALVLSITSPASAFPFSSKEEAAEATVSAFSKNGPVTGTITFSAQDFKVDAAGKVTLDAIVLSSLPDAGAGLLTLANQAVQVGDTVVMSAISGLRFTPSAAPTMGSATFTFTPVFSNGATGADVPVSVYLLAASNGAPIAEHLSICTYKNVAVTGQFSATDPEGDLLTYQLVGKPARGAVTLPEEGANEFVYTPYENKSGKDSFTYAAVDAVGNTSEPATVKIRIDKASTKVTYADMDGVPAYKAAIRLAEEGVFIGECMGGSYFFQPNLPISRGEFVAMAMNACGVQALENVERTGFADDLSIPTWAKPYLSSALKSGLIQGAQNENGEIVVNATTPMTRAEASVFLDRLLQISDTATPTLFVDSEAAPAWAYQSAVNLASCGVLRPDSAGALALDASLSRAGAAELLCGALEVLDARDSGGWFKW